MMSNKTWTRMNYRHSGWSKGYRYFATWSSGLGMWNGGLGHLARWLTEYYGPSRIEMHGPLTQQQLSQDSFWHTPVVGMYPNPHWGVDSRKRRVYVTEETLLWARLMGKID